MAKKDNSKIVLGESGFPIMHEMFVPKAIFPFDPRGAYGEAGGFREEYPGGVIHLFRFLLQVYASAHQQKGQPKPFLQGEIHTTHKNAAPAS